MDAITYSANYYTEYSQHGEKYNWHRVEMSAIKNFAGLKYGDERKIAYLAINLPLSCNGNSARLGCLHRQGALSEVAEYDWLFSTSKEDPM